MENNIICIDLEKLSVPEVISLKYSYKDNIIDIPCALSDTVEKFKVVQIGNGYNDWFHLHTKENVEEFKKNHLYKPETLEDGIYEAKTNRRKNAFTYVWFISNGKAHFDKELTSKWGDSSKLINPRKIADL